MRCTGKMLLLLLLLMVVCSGCSMHEGDDGVKKLVFGLTAQQHEDIGEAGEAVTGMLGLLSSFYAPLGAAAVAAGAGTAVWKNKQMKKAVVQKENPLKMLVKVLEGIKSAEDPKLWTEVRGRIKKEYPSLEVDHTIKTILREMKDEKA